jgi:hypothetical protein
MGSKSLAASKNSSCRERLLQNAEECDDSGVFAVGYSCTVDTEGGTHFDELLVCFRLDEEGIKTNQPDFGDNALGTCVCESNNGLFNTSHEMLCRGDGEDAWAEHWNVNYANPMNDGFAGGNQITSFITTCKWTQQAQDDCEDLICD